MGAGWESVPLGMVLHQRAPDVQVDPTQRYQFAGVYSFARGVFRAQERMGTETSYRTLVQIRSGEFVYPKLMAWEGGFGVVPPECDGCYVSPEFQVFQIDDRSVLPRWIELFFQVPAHWQAIAGGSIGTNMRRQRLHPTDLLRHTVLLPPLDEQRRIVARIDALAAKIAEARGLREEATVQVTAAVAAARRTAIGEAPTADWAPLSKFVADIENGKSPATEGRPAGPEEWAVLKVGAVSFGTFDERENKALPASFKPLTQYEVKPDDFLMSRANTAELVGACAIVRHTRRRLMLSDKIFRFRFRPSPSVVPEFLDHALKSSSLRAQIVAAASGTSPTMKNISKEKVLALRVPDLPVAEQRRIVAELDALQSKVDAVKRLQTETSFELDALLPAILDRAFKGEL